MSNFGERLNELLFENEMNAKELADDINISVTTINRWRNNETQFFFSNLVALADYFNVSTDFILCRTEDNSKVTSKILPSFSKRLREVMKEKGISSYKLRKISKYDGKYFQQWDNGSEPTASTLVELANILDCTVDYLIGRE